MLFLALGLVPGVAAADPTDEATQSATKAPASAGSPTVNPTVDPAPQATEPLSELIIAGATLTSLGSVGAVVWAHATLFGGTSCANDLGACPSQAAPEAAIPLAGPFVALGRPELAPVLGSCSGCLAAPRCSGS